MKNYIHVTRQASHCLSDWCWCADSPAELFS